MTRLLLNRAHYPVTALGPGVRAGVWTQGCTIGCAGCVSQDTWPADPQTAVEVEAVLGWLACLPGPVDGVTISGGEPFQQPEALEDLLVGIHAWRAGVGQPLDILVYSGYPFSRLARSHSRLLELCDAVIAGPYVDRRNTGLLWRGSANQRIVPLTSLGRDRYGETDEAPRMQVSVEADRIWCIGIPRRGDLERLTDQLEQAGIRPQGVSWRP